MGQRVRAIPQRSIPSIAEKGSERPGAVKGACISRRSEPLTARTALKQCEEEGMAPLGTALALALLEAIALAVHLQNVHVVGEPIQQRARQTLRTQHFGPFLKR